MPQIVGCGAHQCLFSAKNCNIFQKWSLYVIQRCSISTLSKEGKKACHQYIFLRGKSPYFKVGGKIITINFTVIIFFDSSASIANHHYNFNQTDMCLKLCPRIYSHALSFLCSIFHPSFNISVIQGSDMLIL